MAALSRQSLRRRWLGGNPPVSVDGDLCAAALALRSHQGGLSRDARRQSNRSPSIRLRSSGPRSSQPGDLRYTRRPAGWAVGDRHRRDHRRRHRCRGRLLRQLGGHAELQGDRHADGPSHHRPAGGAGSGTGTEPGYDGCCDRRDRLGAFRPRRARRSNVLEGDRFRHRGSGCGCARLAHHLAAPSA